ncbi:uncharacterized protein H6S33_012252 [Morchella sextelata]|uniref:uncharacterized protein n=1 Tax=Morchella sextelata TaxID=1174677 RepID=UPI001D036778|nr:uncharacterized protein H6S33_012252 [Morchella sextelata]KAH0609706.1 hypothetical protein H6S33_012252 [Morchella sextelata]
MTTFYSRIVLQESNPRIDLNYMYWVVSNALTIAIEPIKQNTNQINRDNTANETVKVIYTVSCLEERALDQVGPLVNANSIDFFSSVTFFVDHMEASFRDLNTRSTTHHQLVLMRQGKGDFATYYSQFIRNVSHLHYNKGVKIDELAERLSDRPNMVEPYATMSMTIDNHM